MKCFLEALVVGILLLSHCEGSRDYCNLNDDACNQETKVLDLIKDLMNEVAAVIPAKWRDVGIQLGLASGTLDSIQHENSGKPQVNQRSFEYVFYIWKQRVTRPYIWKTIVDVLRTPSVGENRLADELQAKYINGGEHNLALMTGKLQGKDGHHGKEYNIVVVGRTGDGKSTLCRTLALRLGLSPDDTTVFQTSSGASSHTHDPETWMSENSITRVMDTPGLMDTHGVERDEDNIAKIVRHVSALGYVHGFILMVNEQAPRLDSGMQDAVKLLVDSFGPKCLNNMGIVYTRAFGMVSPKESLKRTDEYKDMLSTRTNTHIHHLASWQVDLQPNDLKLLGLSDGNINDRLKKRDNTLDEIIRWARAKIPVDTTGAIIGEYEQRKHAREAEEKRKEAEAMRIHENSVISLVLETKSEEYHRTSDPIIKDVQRERKEWAPVLGIPGQWVGNKETVYYTEKVHVGNKVTKFMREKQRSVSTLGSGKVIYGEWTTLREWPEVVN